jgi:hypothetical protein
MNQGLALRTGGISAGKDVSSQKGEVVFLLGIGKKNIPMVDRVMEALEELKLQMEALRSLAENEKRFMTMDEWRKFRKFARHGIRVARCFSGDTGYGCYFAKAYSTVNYHLLTHQERLF